MNRRQAIRNSLIALCAAMLPELLRPSAPEVSGDAGYDGIRGIPMMQDEFPELFMLKKRRGGTTIIIREDVFDKYKRLYGDSWHMESYRPSNNS